MNSLRFKFLSLLIFSVSMISCRQGSNKNADIPENAVSVDGVKNPVTASPDSGKAKSSLPVFQFKDEEHDFGSITQGEKISYAFRFKNVGVTDLVIRSANGSCGCTVPEWPKDPIPPGKEGLINVTFNSEGKEGMQHKTVTLIANTIPNTKVLTITGEVVPAGKK